MDTTADLFLFLPDTEDCRLAALQFLHRGGDGAKALGVFVRVTKTEIRLSDGTAIPLPRGAYEGVNRAIINMR